MTKSKKIALAVGNTLICGLPVTSVSADILLETTHENPFQLTELSSGYLQTVKAGNEKGQMKMKSGSCGEGKCGSSMMMGSEEKTVEGKCAGNKPMPKANVASPKKDKMMEGQCGEGKCGASM